MKKLVISLVAVTVLVLMVACGGSDSTEEPTSTLTPTPTPTEEATQTPTPDEPTPSPTSTQAATPPQTSGGDPVETVLESVISDLVLAYVEGDDGLQVYKGPNTSTLATLRNNSIYYTFATEETDIMSSEGNAVQKIDEGFHSQLWVLADSPPVTALADYSDSILFALCFDNETKKFELYISPDVTPLTKIASGQEYCFMAGIPPMESCQTR